MSHATQENLSDKTFSLSPHYDQRYVPGLEDLQNTRDGMTLVEVRFHLSNAGLLKPLPSVFQFFPGRVFGPLLVAGRI